MAITTLEQVAARLGRTPEGAEASQIGAWIGDVERKILRRIPDLVAKAVVDPEYAESVAAVVAAVVIRKVNNPTGKLQERIDDYSYGLTADAARSDLTLTSDEWADLLPTLAATAYTVRPSFVADRTVPPW